MSEIAIALCVFVIVGLVAWIIRLDAKLAWRAVRIDILEVDAAHMERKIGSLLTEVECSRGAARSAWAHADEVEQRNAVTLRVDDRPSVHIALPPEPIKFARDESPVLGSVQTYETRRVQLSAVFHYVPQEFPAPRVIAGAVAAQLNVDTIRNAIISDMEAANNDT